MSLSAKTVWCDKRWRRGERKVLLVIMVVIFCWSEEVVVEEESSSVISSCSRVSPATIIDGVVES